LIRNIEHLLIRNIEGQRNEADSQVKGCDGHALYMTISLIDEIKIMISLIGDPM